jgi:hypothetical protein
LARGRKPKDPENPKNRQKSLRLGAGLLIKIEKAAKADGRTVSEEITRRLDRSFIGEEARAVETFGSHETYALAFLIAHALRELRDQTGHWWHRDRFTFDHAVAAVNEIMSYFRPSGRRSVPGDMPVLEMMRDNRLKTGDVVSQARTYPFGKLAGRMAAFRVQFPLPEGQEITPHDRIFKRIAFELQQRLSGCPQADLINWSKK